MNYSSLNRKKKNELIQIAKELNIVGIKKSSKKIEIIDKIINSDKKENQNKKEKLDDQFDQIVNLPENKSKASVSKEHIDLISKQIENKVISRLKNIKFNRIYHISDIHIRLNERLEEYQQVFNNLYSFLESEKYDNKLIVITGDLFHVKNKITPDNFVLARKFISDLSDYGEVIIIAGNHDMVEDNTNFVDSITALYYDTKNPKIHYLKYSGIYTFGNIDFSVSSLYDKKFIQKQNHPKTNNKNINVALYHGTLNGSKNDFGKTINDKIHNRKVSDFDDFDYVLLGDIHKHQFLKENIAYSGSLIQQNFGENVDNHGVLVWDLIENKHRFQRIKNDYSFRTKYIKDNIYIIPTNLTKNIYLRVFLKNSKKETYDIFINELSKTTNIISSKYENIFETENKIIDSDYFKQEFNDFEIISKICADKFDEKCSKKIIEIHNEIKKSVNLDEISDFRNQNWRINKITFKNIFIFGNCIDNTINFDSFTGKIIGIIGKNAIGKSNIMHIILFTLFDNINGLYQNSNVIHFGEKRFEISCEITCAKTKYKILKTGNKNYKKSSKKGIAQTVKFQKFNRDSFEWESINKEDIAKTKKDITAFLSSWSNFMLTNIYSNTCLVSLLNMTAKIQYDKLSSIFLLDIYKSYENEAKNQIRNLKKDINVLQGKKEGISLNFSNSEINNSDKLNSELKLLNSEYEQCLNNLNNLNEKIKNNNSIIEEKNKIKQKLLKSFDNTQYDFSPEEELNKLKNYKELVDPKKKYDRIIESLEENISNYKKELFPIKNNTRAKRMFRGNTTKFQNLNQIREERKNDLTELISKNNNLKILITELENNKNEIQNEINYLYSKRLNITEKDYSNELLELNNFDKSFYDFLDEKININSLVLEKESIKNKLYFPEKGNLGLKENQENSTEINVNFNIIENSKKLQQINLKITNLTNKINHSNFNFIKSSNYEKEINELNNSIKRLILVPEKPKYEILQLENKIKLLEKQKKELLSKTINNDNVQKYISDLKECQIKDNFHLIKKDIFDILINLLENIKNNKIDEMNKLNLDLSNKINHYKNLLSKTKEYCLILDKNKKIKQNNHKIKQKINNLQFSKIRTELNLLIEKKNELQNLLYTHKLYFNHINLEKIKKLGLKIHKQKKIIRLKQLLEIKNIVSNIENNKIIKSKINEGESKLKNITKNLLTEKEKLEKFNENISEINKDLDEINKLISNQKNNKIICELEEKLKINKICNQIIYYNSIKIKMKNNRNIQEKINLISIEIENKCNETNKIIHEKNKINENEKQLLIQKNMLEDKINQIKKYKNNLTEINYQLNNNELMLDYYSKYKEIVSVQNAPIFVVKEKLKMIQQHVNMFLEQLTSFTINITIGKKAENYKKEQLLFDINKNGQKLVPFQLSGYESFILNIALKSALNKWSFLNKSELFMIDEGMDCIDSKNVREKFPILLQLLEKNYSQIIIITHIPEIEDMLKERILIRNNGKYSFIDKIIKK